jgi:hypothetical protein
MPMLAYSEIVEDKKDPGAALLKFTDYEPNVYMEEYYCTSPNCDCTNVLLSYFEMEQDTLKGPLFRLTMDLTTEKYVEQVVKNKKVNYLYPLKANNCK